MAYQDWFDSWRNGDVHLRGYFRPPEKLTCSEIPGMDANAARLQEEARRLLEDLSAYRQALAARYAALETAPYRLRLSLVRRPGWRSGVTYDLTLSRVYEDGTEVREIEEHYPGKQRHDAISRFETLRRQRPGIEAVKNIEKQPWERR